MRVQELPKLPGYVERMYHLTPDLAKHYWVSSFNWGEDEVVTIGNIEYLMGFSIDRETTVTISIMVHRS